MPEWLGIGRLSLWIDSYLSTNDSIISLELNVGSFLVPSKSNPDKVTINVLRLRIQYVMKTLTLIGTWLIAVIIPLDGVFVLVGVDTVELLERSIVIVYYYWY